MNGDAGLDKLSKRQRDLLQRWFPAATVVRDHSWGLVGTTVLELSQHDGRYILKAGDEADQHLAREVLAHRRWLTPWTSIGRAPRMVAGDEDAKLLATRFLPGELVKGGPYELRPDTYRQAGRLLALLHGQAAMEDPDYEARTKANMLTSLGGPHRIAPGVTERLRAIVGSWPTPPSVLVPTHGDWQPRNWLMHDGELRVIDFGRAEMRPRCSDFSRIAAQRFRADPRLETAFFEGYGDDPREPGAWQRERFREAIGTAVWGYRVGDEHFERQGHRMIEEVLADLT